MLICLRLYVRCTSILKNVCDGHSIMDTRESQTMCVYMSHGVCDFIYESRTMWGTNICVLGIPSWINVSHELCAYIWVTEYVTWHMSHELCERRMYVWWASHHRYMWVMNYVRTYESRTMWATNVCVTTNVCVMASHHGYTWVTNYAYKWVTNYVVVYMSLYIWVRIYVTSHDGHTWVTNYCVNMSHELIYTATYIHSIYESHELCEWVSKIYVIIIPSCTRV